MKAPLTHGAYSSRSVAANAQRCINLFTEANPEDSAFPVTHYPAPGLRKLGAAPNNQGYRCLYRTKSTGELFAVCGNAVYQISSTWVFTQLGTMASSTGIVSMADNGFEVLIVDGTTAGYTIDLVSKTFTVITDPNFYGGTRVDVSDTYFITNRPGTNNWYISLTNESVWNALDIASKTSLPDPLQTTFCINDNVVLVGTRSTEVWYNTGAADFTYQKVTGVLIEQGTVAPYSLAKYESTAFWLSQNEQGQAIVLAMGGFTVQRVSNHAIEDAFRAYGTISDAVGFCYQIAGHAFYQLTFPSADKTWVYDAAEKEWHERCSMDSNGSHHRHAAQVCAFAFGLNVCGDWQNGNLYALDLATYTDNGSPILYLRSWPLIENEDKRMTFRTFIADMEAGNALGTAKPMVSLRWSDDRGASFSDPIQMPLGQSGQYDTTLQWWGLGVGRFRVFELSWSEPVKTALLGAFVDVVPHKS